MATSSLEQAFRELFSAFANRHPGLAYEWRNRSSVMSGRRLDLVCGAGTPSEVYASVLESSVAVGDLGGHTDVEDFGRGLSEEQISEEALRLLADKLKEHGLLS